MLRHPESRTAIAAYNDISALALLHVLRDRGVRIPDQISIVGCDDVPEAAVSRPRLTTLRFPAQEMAEAAVSMMLKRIRSGGEPQASIRLRHAFIAGESCGPPPGS